MASRASFTQSGQSESVCRGQPSVGFVFSHDFKSGLSDHFGVNDGFGRCLLKPWTVLNVTSASLQTAASTVPKRCVRSVFGILLYPSGQKFNFQFVYCRARRAPRPLRNITTLPRPNSQTNKSFPAYSLPITLAQIYPLPLSGHFGRPNGNFPQRMAQTRGTKGGSLPDRIRAIFPHLLPSEVSSAPV